MNVRSCIALAVAVAGTWLAGCTSAPAMPGQDAKSAEDECSVYRSYLPTRVDSEVLALCTRRMGAEYCRRCLGG